jgi:hypothetical protein
MFLADMKKTKDKLLFPPSPTLPNSFDEAEFKDLLTKMEQLFPTTAMLALGPTLLAALTSNPTKYPSMFVNVKNIEIVDLEVFGQEYPKVGFDSDVGDCLSDSRFPIPNGYPCIRQHHWKYSTGGSNVPVDRVHSRDRQVGIHYLFDCDPSILSRCYTFDPKGHDFTAQRYFSVLRQ